MKYSLFSIKFYPFIFFLSFLYGCGSEPNTDELTKYFPLKKGIVWEYKHEEHLTGDEPKVSTMKIENLGSNVFRDQVYSVRRTSNGTDYYLRGDETGIFRYGKRTIVEDQPKMDSLPRMILPLPIPDKTGKSWSVLSQSYTLHRVLPNYEPSYENTALFNMTYSVVGLDEEVSVPAGKYKHCLLVEGQAQIDQLAGANEGNGEIEITTREWYAPGIGMVKMERMEPLDGSVFKGGKILMQLKKVSGF